MARFSTGPDLATLPQVRRHVLDAARNTGKADAILAKLELVLEEAFVNVAKHAYQGDAGEIEVDCSASPGSFTCLLRDWGPPFNPLAGPAKELSTDIDARPVGGVGLLLVATMSDSCAYARNGNANELTIQFNLPSSS